VFLAELVFFIALKARKTLVQHEVSYRLCRNCMSFVLWCFVSSYKLTD